MTETVVTIVGNMVNDPELRFTPAGVAVANFTIASTPRVYDKQAKEYRDGEPLFLRASVWAHAAENVADSLTKGTRVIATGRLKQRQFESKGEKRSVIEMEVDEIGPSLRWAVARPEKAGKSPKRDAEPDPWGAPTSGDSAPPF